MDLIKPAEISGKIMTLIDEAKKKVIIISPYNKFTYWKKLIQRIQKAKDRGVEIKWYIRKNVENNAQQVKTLGIDPIEIENLHCKLYLNEKNAVVTSMNLHEYSDSSSIDIGYLITDPNMYQDLIEFVELYIDSNIMHDALVNENIPITNNVDSDSNKDNDSFKEILINYLQTNKPRFSKDFRIETGFVSKVKAENIVDNFDIYFEPKNSYFRIDLRINFPHKTQNEIYKILESKNKILNDLCGEEIEFGSQMKRLKIDLRIFDNYNYRNWGNGEFELLKPKLDRIITTYLVELDKLPSNLVRI